MTNVQDIEKPVAEEFGIFRERFTEALQTFRHLELGNRLAQFVRCAFGTIAGLEYQHYEHHFGTLFTRDGEPYSPDFAAIARAYGIDGVTVESADAFKPALEKALASNKPCLIDVRMENAPVITAGCWNINDIYVKRGERKPGRV